ncbi:MAG: hypothetical protein ABL867_05850 [Rickettsiales bacterium]|nr:hypothetical protein [Methyloglobulus sp.]
MSELTFTRQDVQEKRAGTFDFTVISAYENVAGSGSKSIRLELMSSESWGYTTDIWFYSAKNNSPITMGMNLIQTKLMKWFNLDSLKFVNNCIVKRYDYETKLTSDVRVKGLPEMKGKMLTLTLIEESRDNINYDAGDPSSKQFYTNLVVKKWDEYNPASKVTPVNNVKDSVVPDNIENDFEVDPDLPF